MAGGLFHWGVPLCVGLAKRWRAEDAADIARRLDGALGDGGRVLDLGGGTGHLAALLAAEIRRPVTVLDASAPMLRHAAAMPGVEPVLGDAADMPFADATFDAVVTFDALHHFVRPDEALAEAARVVRPGAPSSSGSSIHRSASSGCLPRSSGWPGNPDASTRPASCSASRRRPA